MKTVKVFGEYQTTAYDSPIRYTPIATGESGKQWCLTRDKGWQPCHSIIQRNVKWFRSREAADKAAESLAIDGAA
jgi:hypothetical protein